jgi:CBS domain-containing protein
MRISDVIRRKQDPGIVTIGPGETVSALLALLEEHRIGAVVVTDDGTTPAGIVSERDIVRHLHSDGAALLDATVSSIMTSALQTCTPEDDLDTLARQMTEHRVRHVPVLRDGRLHSIVSIGDIVKNRIDELQTERDQLVGYIQQ